MDVKKYVQAARLRTLPLSISGIIVGSFLAIEQQQFQWEIAVLALLTTIGFQIISNFANDYGDGVKGTDKNRIGEKRLVASGEISPKQMKRAMQLAIGVTLLIALYLIYVAFGNDNFYFAVLFFFLGISSIIAAIKYTVGKNAYGYSGFGDVFVFLFFGILSVVGSNFLYTIQLHWLVLFPAVSIGALSTSVLNLNNMRDMENDAIAGKNTLVVKKGMTFAKRYHFVLIFISLISAVVFVINQYSNPLQFLFLIAYIPLVKHIQFIKLNKNPREIDGELKKVALTTFLFAILFGLGQVL